MKNTQNTCETYRKFRTSEGIETILSSPLAGSPWEAEYGEARPPLVNWNSLGNMAASVVSFMASGTVETLRGLFQIVSFLGQVLFQLLRGLVFVLGCFVHIIVDICGQTRESYRRTGSDSPRTTRGQKNISVHIHNNVNLRA